MKIVVKIKNNFGEFESIPIEVTEGEYSEVLEMSKNFHKSGGYEMPTKEGFLVIPPEITKHSILLLKIIDPNDTSEK